MCFTKPSIFLDFIENCLFPGLSGIENGFSSVMKKLLNEIHLKYLTILGNHMDIIELFLRKPASITSKTLECFVRQRLFRKRQAGDIIDTTD